MHKDLFITCGTEVKTIGSTHSGIYPGMIGVVEKDMGSGCAVKFNAVEYVKLFGGATAFEARTVYMSKSELKIHQPEQTNDNQTQEQDQQTNPS